MRKAEFFTLLQTTSSEVSRRNLFKTRATTYVPDLFVILFCVTLFISAVALDIVLLFLFVFNTGWVVAAVFAISLLPHSIFEFIFDRKRIKECLSIYIPNQVFHVCFYLLGMGSIFVAWRILLDTFAMEKSRTVFMGFPYPFFHSSNENLSSLKIYCCIHLVLKCIPQFFIVSVFILDGLVTGALAIVLGVNILLNILIFCQVMATTFPIRKVPRVFTNSTCVLFNALNKFMATMCACCIHLIVFSVVFKCCKYYAILATLLRSVVWVIPTWRMLNAQMIPISRTCFVVYFIFLSLVFGFIYVHPFEGIGKFYYYIFYLIDFFYELFLIYLIADANVESISYYFTFKILMLGFLSFFGMLNILHKYRENRFLLFVRGKSLEMMTIEYRDVENNENKAEGSESKEKRESSESKNKLESKESKQKLENSESQSNLETSKSKRNVDSSEKENVETDESKPKIVNKNKPGTSGYKENTGKQVKR